jgi:hypothetical protein
MTVVTPEMEAFIQDNNCLSDSAIVELLEKNFNIKISLPTAFRYLEKARANAAAINSSKVEAVREQVLDNANIYAAKYLRMIDDEIVALDKILKTGSIAFDKSGEESDAPGCLNLDTIKDRVAVSQSLQKAVSMILQFVAPAADNNINMTFKPDYSTLTDEELDALELIAVKTARTKKDASN